MAENKINFTKAALDALPIPASGQRATYHDAKANGLQIRVGSTGVKTFCVFRRIKGGQPERMTLGRYPSMTIEQARRKAAEINATIEGGANPAEAKRALKAELTFADLFKEYLERHAKVRKRTWAEDEAQYRQYLETPFGSKKISAIDRKMIAAWHSGLPAKGITGSRANRIKALVSAVFGRAVEWGHMDSNPAQGVRNFPTQSRDRFLQSDELPRFFQAVAAEPSAIIRDYILLSLLTGARRGNVVSMRWKDVNLSEGVWRIPMTKNGTPQNLPLSPDAVAILQARLEQAAPGAEYVFPGDGKDGHLKEPRKGWERVLKRAGLEDLRLHDLRRTLGSWQAKTGASMVIIGKSLNHKSQQATAIYARLDIDPVRESVERATGAMLAAAGVKESAEVIQLKAKRA